MNGSQQPASENQPGHALPSGQVFPHPSRQDQPTSSPTGTAEASAKGTLDQIRIGKTTALIHVGGHESTAEAFTMTLGAETITLLPLKSWDQLDIYKWSVRGKLPGAPAGLEIALDHVKVAGETVRIDDPDGCAKLEQAFGEWLALERTTVQSTKKKPGPAPGTPTSATSPQLEPQPLHYKVEVDKRGQVHLHCLRGKTVEVSVGLNLPGINSLSSQGLLRKPHKLQVGALHDWVELDGVLCSFENGQNDSAKLERLLNERFIPPIAFGQGKEILILANAASPTGFDIQFPVSVGGVHDIHRHHLNDESLGLLHDPHRCGLLVDGLIIKLIPPALVFKRKTPDGGEQYLESSKEHTITVADEDGLVGFVDLSRPVNYLRLSPVELMAMFNHPAINRHVVSAPGASPPRTPHPAPPPALAETVVTLPAALAPQAGVAHTQAEAPVPAGSRSIEEVAPRAENETLARAPRPLAPPRPADASKQPAEVKEDPAQTREGPLADATTIRGLVSSAGKPHPRPHPNEWLKPVLAQPSIRHDWFACLSYSKLAERFGNSQEGRIGPIPCWFIALGEAEDIGDPAFRGIFMTDKGGLGFVGEGFMLRFCNGVVFLGPPDSAIEGVGVELVAVAVNESSRVFFVVADHFRSKFGVPDQRVAEELSRLRAHGLVVLSVGELLTSSEAVEVVWTVPAEQTDPSDPQALESTRLDSQAAPALRPEAAAPPSAA